MTLDSKIIALRRQHLTVAEIAQRLEIAERRVDMALAKAPRRLRHPFADLGAGEFAGYSLLTTARKRGQE